MPERQAIPAVKAFVEGMEAQVILWDMPAVRLILTVKHLAVYTTVTASAVQKV